MADKKNGAGALSLAMQRDMLMKCKLATPGQRLTYMMLMSHSNRFGRAVPGNPRLAKYNGVKLRQIGDDLNAVEQARLAKRGKMVTVSNGNGGFYRAMEWLIKLPDAPKPEKAEKPKAESTPRVAKPAKPKPKRTKSCPHPGLNHETVGACNQYDYRVRKGEITPAAPAPKPPAPEPRKRTPKPEPTTEEIAAKAKRDHDEERRRRPWDFQEEAAQEREEKIAAAQARIDSGEDDDI